MAATLIVVGLLGVRVLDRDRHAANEIGEDLDLAATLLDDAIACD